MEQHRSSYRDLKIFATAITLPASLLLCRLMSCHYSIEVINCTGYTGHTYFTLECAFDRVPMFRIQLINIEVEVLC